MNRDRYAQLLIGHALSDGVPLGPVLRELPVQHAHRAAQVVEGGQLGLGLQIAGFPDDLAWLAARWPAALRPAQRRLASLPAPPLFFAPVLQVLGLGGLIATVQILVTILLQVKVLPTLLEMSAEVGVEPVSGLLTVLFGDLLFVAVVPALVFWVAWGGRSIIPNASWWRHLGRAREACLLAALHDADAPEDIRDAFARGCPALMGRGLGSLELELLATRSVASAEAALQRLVIGARLVVYGALVGMGLYLLGTIYGLITSLGVLL